MLERAGLTLDYSTRDAVTKDTPIVVGSIIGIPNITCPKRGEDEKPNFVALRTEGVYELPKDGTEIAQGAKVYLTDGKVTATAGDVPAGIAWTEATADAATVMVKINA